MIFLPVLIFRFFFYLTLKRNPNRYYSSGQSGHGKNGNKELLYTSPISRIGVKPSDAGQSGENQYEYIAPDLLCFLSLGRHSFVRFTTKNTEHSLGIELNNNCELVVLVDHSTPWCTQLRYVTLHLQSKIHGVKGHEYRASVRLASGSEQATFGWKINQWLA